MQEDAIKLILEGHHVVLNIPTGGEKSFPQIAANIFAKGKQKYLPLLDERFNSWLKGAMAWTALLYQ